MSVTKTTSVTEFIACLLHKLQPNVKVTLRFHSNSNRTNYSTFNQTDNARSRYHSCSGKAINITYSECVFADLSIQHVMRWCICGLSGCTVYFTHYFIKGPIFVKKITERKMYRLIFWTTFTCNICYSTKNWTRCDQKCKFTRHIFELNYQMSRKSTVPCARTDGQTDMMYPAVAFRILWARLTKPVQTRQCTYIHVQSDIM